MSRTIRIIHGPTEAEPFVVVDKPAGLPSAPLRDGDDSALTQAVALFPDIADVAGRKPVEKGLLHRIDTATRGLLLIAATDEACAFLAGAQERGQFQKWYRATVDHVPDAAERLGGFPAPPFTGSSRFGQDTIVIQSRFRAYGKNGRAVRPVSEQSGRAACKKSGNTLYRTEVTVRDESSVICTIRAGYRHQVRCHLAWLGLPVRNDPLYNPFAHETAGELAFTAYKIAFPHPKASGLVQYTVE